jgi:hypothetical protein
MVFKKKRKMNPNQIDENQQEKKVKTERERNKSKATLRRLVNINNADGWWRRQSNHPENKNKLSHPTMVTTQSNRYLNNNRRDTKMKPAWWSWHQIYEPIGGASCLIFNCLRPAKIGASRFSSPTLPPAHDLVRKTQAYGPEASETIGVNPNIPVPSWLLYPDIPIY